MKRAVIFLTFGVLVLSLAVLVSCSDKAAAVLEPQQSASQVELLSNDDNTVIAMSEEDMIDSLYAQMVSWYEADGEDYDPDMLLQMVTFQAKALLGTDIYLSDYEVDALPSQQDPQYGHLTLTTSKGTFYFLMPHCLCGHIMYEQKYFTDEDFQMLTCGCIESLL